MTARQPKRYRPRVKPGTVTDDGAVILADGTPTYMGQVYILAGQVERAKRHGWRAMVSPLGVPGRFVEVRR